jgi:hypothetical protein
MEYNYENKIENWLEKNIISYGGELFNALFEKEIINYEDIDNLYDYIDRNDFTSDEEYNKAIDNQMPQQVIQWFIITEEGYDKFKYLGYPVVKCKELYFYGRTSYGQPIASDFDYLKKEKLCGFLNSI